jgi:hypothetical protein
MSEDIRIRHLTLFKRQSHLVKEWKKHQLRSVHQEAARDAVLTSLDENSVRKFIHYNSVVHFGFNNLHFGAGELSFPYSFPNDA